MSKRRGAPVKFPSVKKMNEENPFVFYSKEKVLALYLQHTGTKADKLAKNVSDWFVEEAKKQGWVVQRVKPYGNGNNAGFVLWVADMIVLQVISQKTVTIKNSR